MIDFYSILIVEHQVIWLKTHQKLEEYQIGNGSQGIQIVDYKSHSIEENRTSIVHISFHEIKLTNGKYMLSLKQNLISIEAIADI